MASVEDVSQDPGEDRTPNPHQSTPEGIPVFQGASVGPRSMSRVWWLVVSRETTAADSTVHSAADSAHYIFLTVFDFVIFEEKAVVLF